MATGHPPSPPTTGCLIHADQIWLVSRHVSTAAIANSAAIPGSPLAAACPWPVSGSEGTTSWPASTGVAPGVGGGVGSGVTGPGSVSVSTLTALTFE
jgi:hypothetical protein